MEERSKVSNWWKIRVAVVAFALAALLIFRSCNVHFVCRSLMALETKQIQLGVIGLRHCAQNLSGDSVATDGLILALTLNYGVDEEVRSSAIDIIAESDYNILLELSKHKLLGGHTRAREMFESMNELCGNSERKATLALDWSRSVTSAIENENFEFLTRFLHPIFIYSCYENGPDSFADQERFSAGLLDLSARISSPTFDRLQDKEDIRLLRNYSLGVLQTMNTCISYSIRKKIASRLACEYSLFLSMYHRAIKLKAMYIFCISFGVTSNLELPLKIQNNDCE